MDDRLGPATTNDYHLRKSSRHPYPQVARDCRVRHWGNLDHYQLAAGRACNERDRTTNAHDCRFVDAFQRNAVRQPDWNRVGLVGVKDRASRKFYPLLGLALNVAILMTLVALALVGLSMKAP